MHCFKKSKVVATIYAYPSAGIYSLVNFVEPNVVLTGSRLFSNVSMQQRNEFSITKDTQGFKQFDDAVVFEGNGTPGQFFLRSYNYGFYFTVDPNNVTLATLDKPAVPFIVQSTDNGVSYTISQNGQYIHPDRSYPFYVINTTPN